MQSQSGTRKLEPSIGHCQVLVWELEGVRFPLSTPALIYKHGCG